MDNDTLINQARRLYAVLHVKQYVLSIGNKAEFDRLDHLVMWAYCRYQRRLNRCVLCYQHRLTDCSREFEGKKRRFCPNLTHRPHKPDPATADAFEEKP
ncbi:MAG: hypothetical protein M8364_09445 [Methylobacter sp.]|uniref:hypothetical protein n=1 Tax=Methylobacter sp. TaxID=2051955 RepID=UPI00258FA4F5|nr:hypothetical protein [Methylobacter sp.]MCL7421113.1 hypothetical protein [Methylobacter sp.]